MSTNGWSYLWPRLAWHTELERRAAMAPKYLLTDLTATEEDHLDVRHMPMCVANVHAESDLKNHRLLRAVPKIAGPRQQARPDDARRSKERDQRHRR